MQHLRSLFALTLLAFSACATSGAAREADKAEKELVAAHDAQRAQESSINAAAFPGEAPRCDRICPARESICMSAARICGMDGVGPDRRKAACDDASERCERVRSSVMSQCDCTSGLVQANYVQR